MDYLLRRLARIAAKRGMSGEHWAWFVIAAGAFLLRRARRQEDPLVLSRRIAPGDQLLVSIRSPKSPPVDSPSPS